MIKSLVLRPRPYMEHPDRVRGVADVGNKAPLTDVAAALQQRRTIILRPVGTLTSFCLLLIITLILSIQNAYPSTKHHITH